MKLKETEAAQTSLLKKLTHNHDQQLCEQFSKFQLEQAENNRASDLEVVYEKRMSDFKKKAEREQTEKQADLEAKALKIQQLETKALVAGITQAELDATKAELSTRKEVKSILLYQQALHLMNSVTPGCGGTYRNTKMQKRLMKKLRRN